MRIRKFISTTIHGYLKEQLQYKLDGDYIYYFIGDDKIGYIEYYFDGGNFSEHLPNINENKEFYISMIEVYKEFRGKDYATQMFNQIKTFAKKKGATIITLRVDYGLGFDSRNVDKGLEKLYLKNKFKYQHTPEESKLDDTKNLGAMYYEIK